jgi:arsenate reductase
MRGTEAIGSGQIFNVLFLCTHNSGRSVIAECILNRLGQGRFRGYSAGSTPRGSINSYALELLRNQEYDVSGLRSKSWDEFGARGAPHMDFFFTVCDDAANEVCPIWPGHPMTAHWSVPDPSRAEGNEAEKRVAFLDTYRMLYHRMGHFVALPTTALDRMALKTNLDEIGRAAPAVEKA